MLSWNLWERGHSAFLSNRENFAPSFFRYYDGKACLARIMREKRCLGVARIHKRRSTDPWGATVGVVHTSVRVIAADLLRRQLFSAADV